MDSGFNDLGIRDALVKGLVSQGITNPTEIQQKTIPAILSGKDVIARSQTGSGKTLAYLLPAFEKLDVTLRSTQILILTPTHELAAQVVKQVELLAENAQMPVRCALIIGNASMTRQLEKLKQKPQIVVGSVGRILDLIEKRKIQAHTVQTIVIDEGDRMLDEKNLQNVQAVIKKTLRDRQLVVVSASINDDTRKTATNLMKEEKVDLFATEEALLPENIQHYFIQAEHREKFVALRKVLAGEKPRKAIIFLNNPENIEVTVDKLNFHGIRAVGIYGNAYKTDRRNAMEEFRSGRATILVASDIGARGIDVLDVTHIINLDVPEEPTFYLHRAGRTGRKGKQGIAISIVTPFERKWIRKYEKTWNISFVEKDMSYGKLTDIAKLKKAKLEKGQKNKKKISSKMNKVQNNKKYSEKKGNASKISKKKQDFTKK